MMNEMIIDEFTSCWVLCPFHLAPSVASWVVWSIRIEPLTPAHSSMLSTSCW